MVNPLPWPALGRGSTGTARLRLLLIEDNPRLSEYVAVALRGHGFAVDIVDNGADAESAVMATSFDVIILDLGLPDIDGLDWLGAMRRRLDQTPVLILTARDGVQDLVLGLNTGADDYLRKPFEMNELVARIRALLPCPWCRADTTKRLAQHEYASSRGRRHPCRFRAPRIQRTRIIAQACRSGSAESRHRRGDL